VRSIYCPNCGDAVPTHARRPVFCHCGTEFGRDTTATKRPEAKARVASNNPSNPWFKIHEYGPDNYDNWNPVEAEKFFKAWKRLIPRYCRCQEDFATLCGRLPPDFSSPKNFAYRSWQWHDAVSRRLKKSLVRWEECESIYGCPWDKTPLKPINFVTSLSPAENTRERQSHCLDTWKAVGGQIKVLNTHKEIEWLKPRFPQVDTWEPCEDVADEPYTFKSMKIKALANAIEGNGWLINSDVEAYGSQRILEKYVQPGVQVFGIRWNHSRDRRFAQEFQWGIDVVYLEKEMARLLPEDYPFAIGHPMWDYSLPIEVLTNGFGISLIHDRFFYHDSHLQRWAQPSWDYGAQWVRDNTELDFINPMEFRNSLDPTAEYSHELGRWVAKDGGLPEVSVLEYAEWKKHVGAQ
jgi:hypothetical protein